jgi:protocatechuate 3,4-dioxygenase beta subunit
MKMELHDDDKPVGRVLTRREVLRMLGGAGTAVFVGGGLVKATLRQIDSTATPEITPEGTEGICVVRPAETEGPYFVDEMLNRSDIRTDPSDGTVKDGIPLYLTFRVSQIQANACIPLESAQVDVWHCDALGVYSDVQDPGFSTKGKKFLRGYQVTDAKGIAKFITIYPGWYSGRTVHIHFKIRTDPTSSSGYEFTSQLFFDDALTDQVFAKQPYAGRGQRNTRNSNDGIYQSGGDQLLLNLVEQDDGYAATFDIGLDLSQPPAQSGGPGGAPPRGSRPDGQNPPPPSSPTPAPHAPRRLTWQSPAPARTRWFSCPDATLSFAFLLAYRKMLRYELDKEDDWGEIQTSLILIDASA